MTQRENRNREQASLEGARAVSPETRKRKRGAAALSIASNSLLVLLKLVVGFWSGSVSVLSEAIHSLTDLVASAIAFVSVRASDAPPDEEHPYGHGKAESISGLLESLLIFGAAVYIVWESVAKLRDPAGHAPKVDMGLAVMGVSALANVFLSGYLHRVARETDSHALEADAQHLRIDVWTSAGVFVGLALTRLTGHSWFDPITALLVALLIFGTAYQLTRNALHLLMDVRLPAEEEAAIQEILETEPRVLGYHKLRTRKSGSHRHVDVHVQVADESTLIQAHALTEELEDRIRETLPATSINIHIEPYHAEMRHQEEAHGIPRTPDQYLRPAPPEETVPLPLRETEAAERTPPSSPSSHSFFTGKYTGAR